MPGEFESILTKLQGKLGKQTIRKASTINRPRPKREVIEIQAINDFIRRNPKADGGSIKKKKGKSLLDFIDVKASGSKSDKQQIFNAPKGITVDRESYNFVANLDIPISKKINILANISKDKGRERIEKDSNELFLGEGGSRKREIGAKYNEGGDGFSGQIMYDVDTGKPTYKINFKKDIDFNRLFRANGGSVNGSEQAAFRAKVEELMDDGYDFGEAVREAMRQGYQDGGIVDEVILTQIKEKFPEFDASKSKFGFAKKDPRYEKVRGMYRKLSGAYKAYDEKRKTDPKRIAYRESYKPTEESIAKRKAKQKSQYKADPKKYLARNRKYVTRPDVALKRRKRAQQRYYYGGQKEKDLARLKKVIASKNVSGYLQNTDNILLKDMIRAANQGDPNLKLVRGGPNNSVVAVQEGNKTYHAVGAQRKPVPGSPKNSIPITKHPTFKKRFEFVKQQKAFANTKIPGTDLTYGKALDFLESEKAGTPLQNKNAAEFEHVKGVRTDYKKGQVALRTANRDKMMIRAALDNKNITLKEADKALKKIGVRDFYKGRYIGAPKINPNKQFDDLKKYVDKSFKLGKLKPIFKRIAKAVPIVGTAIGIADVANAYEQGVRNPIDLFAAYQISPEAAVSAKRYREDPEYRQEQIRNLPNIEGEASLDNFTSYFNGGIVSLKGVK